MDQMTGRAGTFVVSWSQIQIDGCHGASRDALRKGAIWLWRGEAVRLDGATGMPSVDPREPFEVQRRRASAGARRIVGRALRQDGLTLLTGNDPTAFDRVFTLSDGHRHWVVTLIDIHDADAPLLLFTGSIPPASYPLFVAEGLANPASPQPLIHDTEGVVCFTPGTLLETPDGPRAVEDLVAGDKLVTKDAGAEEILWVGSRHVSGARLCVMPDLRPVRIRGGALGDGRATRDLVVSPDHRILLTGDRARALSGDDEVLIAARDLVDGGAIRRDRAARAATYVHVMLPDHHIVVANGVETESFHPGMAALDEVAEDQRLRLFDVMPGLEANKASYGPTTRRVLAGKDIKARKVA